MRLTNCNLECKWCDTPYTWAFTDAKASKHRSGKAFDKVKETTLMDHVMVVDALHDLWPANKPPTLVVISGGEPLMQGRDLVPLVDVLGDEGNDVHIETAGTLLPPEALNYHVTQYNVSPKLAHSGNVKSKRYKPAVLDWFASSHKAYFKFVMKSRSDFNEVDAIVQAHGITPDRVMVMPEATYSNTAQLGMKMLAGEAVARGYGVSSRLHVMIWEDTRGK